MILTTITTTTQQGDEKHDIIHTQRSLKKFEASPKKKNIAGYFCCGNTLPLLIRLEKLIQIFRVLKEMVV